MGDGQPLGRTLPVLLRPGRYLPRRQGGQRPADQLPVQPGAGQPSQPHRLLQCLFPGLPALPGGLPQLPRPPGQLRRLPGGKGKPLPPGQGLLERRQHPFPWGPGPQPLYHPCPGLGRHRHKAPLVGVGGLPQYRVAEPALVPLPGAVAAGGLPPVRPADAAHRAPHGAPHAHLLFDAPVDLQDQLPVGLAAHQVGVRPQRPVGLPGAGGPGGVLLHPAPVDPGRLVAALGVVVKDARLPHKQLGQPLQRRPGEPLPVPVHLVVAQHHREGVHLLRPQRPPGEPLNQRQVLRRYRRGVPLPGAFRRCCPFLVHAVSSFACSVCSSAAARALVYRAWAISVSSCRLMLSQTTSTRSGSPASARAIRQIFSATGVRMVR